MKTKFFRTRTPFKALLVAACLLLPAHWGHAQQDAPSMVTLNEDFLRDVKVLMFMLAIIAALILYIAVVMSVKDVRQLSIRYIWDGIVGRNSADPETDHEYDGIRELDNPMPAWLRLVFIGSIGFAIVYMLHYHVLGTGALSKEEYETEMALAAETYKSVELPDDQLSLVTDAGRLKQAESMFMENCATCHRKDLGGESGPNLTDDHWLHGGTVKDVYHTITDGVPGKSMISWKDRIPSQDRLAIASFILSKAGTNPPDPRAPEGTVAGGAPAADTLATDTAAPR